MNDEGTETYVIGTDEAGYGPNLGPLTIAATVWRVERSASRRLVHTASRQLDGSLKPRTKDDPFRRYARTACEEPDERPLIDDSKAVYGRGGLRSLERATLRMLAPSVEVALPTPTGENLGGLTSPARQEKTLSLRQFWRSVVRQGDVDAWDELFWLREFADMLPIAPQEDAANEGDLDPDANAVRRKCRRKPIVPTVAFQFARATAVFPESFNRRVAEAGNKATLLTQATLTLVAEIVAELPPGVRVYWSADRHGGRKWYRDPLQAAFPDSLVMTVDESPTVSRYRWFRDGAPVDCEFRVGGDSYVPTALASMSAKYLRELCMAAWNAHWRARRPDLRATAGYPGDARRFFEEIRDLLLDAGVCDRTIWRGC